MNDFTYYAPTKIIFGKGKETLIGEELKNAGVEKVLLVCGWASFVKSGLRYRVIKSLKESHIECVEFPRASRNPTLYHALIGVKVAIENNVKAVLAVGGGSVIDTAKAIAAGAVDRYKLWHYFTGLPVEDALPIFTIPTIAGSGSEVNGGAVLTNEETKQKFCINSPRLFPRVSIVNPELHYTVPKEYSNYATVDVIAHSLEAFMTADECPECLMETIAHIGYTAINANKLIQSNPDDYGARAAFAWASIWASTGITVKGLSGYSFPWHMIAHSLSALYDTNHGVSLAIVMSGWLKWKGVENELLFPKPVPTHLHEVGISPEDIPMIAWNALETSKMWKMDKEYTVNVIVEILQKAV